MNVRIVGVLVDALILISTLTICILFKLFRNETVIIITILPN